jgi:hypothetical protein
MVDKGSIFNKRPTIKVTRFLIFLVILSKFLYSGAAAEGKAKAGQA